MLAWCVCGSSSGADSTPGTTKRNRHRHSALALAAPALAPHTFGERLAPLPAGSIIPEYIPATATRARGPPNMTTVARPARAALEEWLLAVAVLANVAVALVARHFPYQDIVNHLTRYVLLDRALGGQVPGWLIVEWRPTTRIVADLGGVALVHVLGPTGALRVLAILPLLLLPAGMYVLLRATAPAHRGWALVGVLSSFSWYYLTGLQDFTLGVALLFFWLAYWWPRRDSGRWTTRLWLSLGCTLLLFVHLSAPLLAVGVLGVNWLRDAVLEFRRTRSRAAFLSPQLGTLLILTLVIALAVGATAVAAVPDEAPMGEPYFRPLGQKALALATPFYSFSRGQLAVMLAGVLLAAGALLRRPRTELLTTFMLCAPAFLVVYLVSPRSIIGAGDVDVRWLPPAFLLPFCAPTATRPPSATLLRLLLAACLAHALTVLMWARRIDPDLDAYDVVMAALPRDASILPLSTDRGRFGRVRPYEYYGLWHTIRGGGQVPGLFSGTGMRREGPAMHHFDHIRVRYQPYQPPPEWAKLAAEPLDCAAIRHDYAYVIQAGVDPWAARMIGACAHMERRVGPITLYRVTAADSGLAGQAERQQARPAHQRETLSTSLQERDRRAIDLTADVEPAQDSSRRDVGGHQARPVPVEQEPAGGHERTGVHRRHLGAVLPADAPGRELDGGDVAPSAPGAHILSAVIAATGLERAAVELQPRRAVHTGHDQQSAGGPVR